MKSKLINNKYTPWFVLSLVFILTIILNYYVQWRCLDSDMASEMVLANLLNKEGVLMSKNWYYSTEVRVFCEQIWFQLGLLISPNNWRIARLIGHSINLAILVISLIFLLYSTSIKEKGIWIAIVLLLPFDFWYLLHVLYGGFYICHTVAVFVMLGLLLRYLNNNKKIYLILLFIFGVIFGLNGIKVLMYFTVPCVFLLIVLSVYKYINNNKSISFYKSLAIGVGISFLSTIIGVAIYLFVICKNYSCQMFEDLVWGNLDISNIWRVISNYLQSLGFISNDYFNADINILSVNGLIGTFGLLNAFVFIFSLVSLFRNKYFKVCKEKPLLLFTACGYMTQTIILSFAKNPFNASYWLPFIPISMIIIELYIEVAKEQGFNTKYIRVILLISFILCSYANNDYYLKHDFKRYEGMHEVTNWLQENGCKKVIAEFWEGNVITEYSNGNIEAFVVDSYENLSIYNHLQSKDHTYVPLEKDTYVVIPLYEKNDMDLSVYEEKGEVVKEYIDLIVYRIK